MSTQPNTLYHGSRFKQTELMPGFLRSGKLVKWDETESNEFLYATTSRNTAMELGFASSLEKAFEIDSFHVFKGIITIVTEELLTLRDVEKIPVYLYTINRLDKDNWVKNDNEHNGLDTEYKTKRTIRSIEECIPIDVQNWLANYVVRFEREAEQKNNGRSKELVTESLPVYLKW